MSKGLQLCKAICSEKLFNIWTLEFIEGSGGKRSWRWHCEEPYLQFKDFGSYHMLYKSTIGIMGLWSRAQTEEVRIIALRLLAAQFQLLNFSAQKLLNFSESQFPHLQNEDDFVSIELLWELNELIYKKHSEEYLATQ